MAGVKCKLVGAEEVQRWLGFIKTQVNGGSDAYDKFETDAKEIIVKRTTNQGQDVKGDRFKLKKDGSCSYLKKSGDMIDGIVSWRTKNKITISHSRPIYGAVHNFGGKSGRGKGFRMPQREWFGLNIKEFTDLKERVLNNLKSIFMATKPK